MSEQRDAVQVAEDAFDGIDAPGHLTLDQQDIWWDGARAVLAAVRATRTGAPKMRAQALDRRAIVDKVFERALENVDMIEGSSLNLGGSSVIGVWIHTAEAVRTWLRDRHRFEVSGEAEAVEAEQP